MGVRTLALIGGCALAACFDVQTNTVDAGPALVQMQEVLTVLGTAMEGHYSADGDFLGDLTGLFVDPPHRDSVSLSLKVSHDGHGWAAFTTHLRLGPSIGCALGWGSGPAAETPGGLVHGGSGDVLCDAVGAKRASD